MQWTEETIARFEQLIADNLSASQIGAELGCSRNAILGKAHRLGLKVNPNSPQSKSARFGLRAEPRAVRSRPSVPRAARVFIPGAVLMRDPTPAGAVAFIDAEPGQCRWFQPFEKGAFGLICANRTVPEKSYCQAHYLRSLDTASRVEAISRLNIKCEAVAA
jgi:hypothetical protein